MIFLFHKLGDSYLEHHWNEMKKQALAQTREIITCSEPEKSFKSLKILIKQISDSTRSICSEKDGLFLLGNFISLIYSNFGAVDKSDLEKAFILVRFHSFVEECFKIKSGYGSQKTTKNVNVNVFIVDIS